MFICPCFFGGWGGRGREVLLGCPLHLSLQVCIAHARVLLCSSVYCRPRAGKRGSHTHARLRGIVGLSEERFGMNKGSDILEGVGIADYKRGGGGLSVFII